MRRTLLSLALAATALTLTQPARAADQPEQEEGGRAGAVRPQVALDFLVYTHAELTDLREHRPFVREEILKRGKILYERKPGTLALLCT